MNARIGAWFERLFSSDAAEEAEEEAAVREEYGIPDPGEAELERDGSLMSYGGTKAAEADLDSFKAPPDRSP